MKAFNFILNNRNVLIFFTAWWPAMWWNNTAKNWFNAFWGNLSRGNIFHYSFPPIYFDYFRQCDHTPKASGNRIGIINQITGVNCAISIREIENSWCINLTVLTAAVWKVARNEWIKQWTEIFSIYSGEPRSTLTILSITFLNEI